MTYFIENDKDLTKKVYILVLTSISNNLKMKRKFRNEFDFWGPCPCLHVIAHLHKIGRFNSGRSYMCTHVFTFKCENRVKSTQLVNA